MTATALYTLIAAGAVLGGYALFRRETDHPAPRAAGDFATGWDHTTVDYQNPADAVTDQRYERNFFERPYQVFCPGGEIRPYEIDAHGQPTGRQLVMPGESPTVGNPAEYVMVGFHPHGFGHFHPHHHHNYYEQLALQQALEAQAEAAALDPTLADPLATAAMGDFMTGLTPAQLAAIHMRSLRRLGMYGGGNWRQQQLQQQLMQQQLLQLQEQVAETQAAAAAAQQQQLADAQAQTELLAAQAATATTGDFFATGYNPYSSWRLRRLLGGGGWRQQQLQQQLLQQQLLQQQLEQAQADLLAAQSGLDPNAAALGAAAGV